MILTSESYLGHSLHHTLLTLIPLRVSKTFWFFNASSIVCSLDSFKKSWRIILIASHRSSFSWNNNNNNQELFFINWKKERLIKVQFVKDKYINKSKGILHYLINKLLYRKGKNPVQQGIMDSLNVYYNFLL